MLSEPLRRLIAEDPRRAMDESLKTIILRTKGTTAGLFIAAAAPELLADRMDADGVERVRAAWASRTSHLRDGGIVTARHYHIWALETRPCGTPLVYIGSDEVLRIPAVREAIGEVQETLLYAIQCDEAGMTMAEAAAVTRYLSSVPMDVAAKRAVEAHLEREEGNISRAAEGLGISRTTLYGYLERFNIPRPRPPKAPEPGS